MSKAVDCPKHPASDHPECWGKNCGVKEKNGLRLPHRSQWARGLEHPFSHTCNRGLIRDPGQAVTRINGITHGRVISSAHLARQPSVLAMAIFQQSVFSPTLMGTEAMSQTRGPCAKEQM